MGGGTIAALIMGVLVVVGGIVAIILCCKSSDSATQQPPHPPPTAHVNNRMFDTSLGEVGNGVGDSVGDVLPSGAFVASTLDVEAQRQHLAENIPNFANYSTPNIPTAAELQARAAGGAGVGPGGRNNVTYATAAEPPDAYDGVTYNALALQSNANAGVQYRPIYDNSGNNDNTNAGVQYRPIYDTSGNGGEQTNNSSGNANSSTCNSVGTAAPALSSIPNYAQLLSKEGRSLPQAPTLPVRKSTKRGKCERPSPKGGTCKNSKKHGSKFCNSHACPVDGCTASKSSSEEYCPLHAHSGGSKGVMRGHKSVYAGFDANEDEEV